MLDEISRDEISLDLAGEEEEYIHPHEGDGDGKERSPPAAESSSAAASPQRTLVAEDSHTTIPTPPQVLQGIVLAVFKGRLAGGSSMAMVEMGGEDEDEEYNEEEEDDDGETLAIDTARQHGCGEAKERGVKWPRKRGGCDRAILARSEHLIHNPLKPQYHAAVCLSANSLDAWQRELWLGISPNAPVSCAISKRTPEVKHPLHHALRLDGMVMSFHKLLLLHERKRAVAQPSSSPGSGAQLFLRHDASWRPGQSSGQAVTLYSVVRTTRIVAKTRLRCRNSGRSWLVRASS